MKTKVFVVLAVAVGVVFLSSNAVTATPPVGFTAKILAKGTLSQPTEIEALGVQFSTKHATDVYVQQVDISPGGSSGWHEHPGLVVVAVATGAVVVTVGCEAARQFSAGQSFVEPPLTPMLVANASSTSPAQNFAAVVVPAGRAPRIELPGAPDCRDRESDEEGLVS
ncbi:MAG TPA: cupin domain-containing protein [Candidatus Limnocylindrales bacterium]|nr:cupin domain-containing protein [Candidatus Limnocylindrales bacterium]